MVKVICELMMCKYNTSNELEVAGECTCEEISLNDISHVEDIYGEKHECENAGVKCNQFTWKSNLEG